MTDRTGFRTRRSLAAVAVAVALVVLATAAPAHAHPPKAGYDLTGSDYILTIGSGGVEAYERLPRRVPAHVGYSYVDLVHHVGQQQGRCEAVGAGYWLGTAFERGVLTHGAAPADADDVSGGYRNPTVARSVKQPAAQGGHDPSRKPAVQNFLPPGEDVATIPADGNGVRWTADCRSDLAGRAVGQSSHVGPYRAVGSASQAEVDEHTGRYTGTSRAYAIGVVGAAGFDSASTFMQVVNMPGADPTITYRMSYFNSGENTSESGITLSGRDIPVERFNERFNAEVKRVGAVARPVGALRAATLTPEVRTSRKSGWYSITISAGRSNFALTAGKPSIGKNQGMRIASINFRGVFGR